MRPILVFKLLAVLAFIASLALAASPLSAAEKRILVYTKNQVGPNLYVHGNISAATAALKKLGTENEFAVDVSDNPADFTDQNLRRYKALVFNNTNNEILENEEQKTALQKFVRAGGGIVGIHSATGSMRKWPWFWSLIGGKFLRHPKMQEFTIKVKDRKDISTAHLGESFKWTDEFYYVDHMAEDLHVLLAGDLTTLKDPGKNDYPGKKFGDEFPLAWRHEFEGGRVWYTALGHNPEHYSDPRFAQHILGGIKWAMGE